MRAGDHKPSSGGATTVRPTVRIEFGRRWMPSDEAARLAPGELVPLDADVDDDVKVYVGGRLVARGEAVAVDGKLAVRVTERVKPSDYDE